MNRDDMLEDLAIHITPGEVAQFFYGDNLRGFYEGFTFRLAEGAGYLVRDRAIYRDFTSRCGNRTNKREDAIEAIIYPHTVQHVYAAGQTEEFMLLARQSAVALRVSSAKAMIHSLSPLLDLDEHSISVRYGKDGLLISNKAASEFVAINSNVPFTYEGLQKSESFLKPRIRTTDATEDFVLYIAFANNEKSAIAKAGELCRIDGAGQHRKEIVDFLSRSILKTGHREYDRALMWAKLTSYFLVVDEFGKGIWAGLPWFRDNWGRDTFIAYPGTLLATGMFDEAKEVLRNFLRYQNKDKKSTDYGRVPNRVASATDIIYNTTDGTPWLIREAYEYLCYTGDTEFAAKIFPAVKLALDGAIQNFVDDQGFLTHADADTWMDAKIEGKLPWSARGTRANDIQALWFTALQAGAKIAELNHDKPLAASWNRLAEKLKQNFPALFWDPRGKRMADRVDQSNRADFKVRPNQLMLISVPVIDNFITEKQGSAIVTQAINELLYPYGIASLSQSDPYFHPYHHRDELHHFDSAYHNGTVWGWNAGPATTALCRHGQTELAWKLAKNLSAQILNNGCRGSMSELIEAIPEKPGLIKLSGTWAQAWSTAEFVRNGYQDFGGFNPRLLDGEIILSPHIPNEWTTFSAVYPFGSAGRLSLTYTKTKGRITFVVQVAGYAEPLKIQINVDAFGRRYSLACTLDPSDTCALTIEKSRGAAIVDGTKYHGRSVRGAKLPNVKALSFAKPTLKHRPPALREKDYLKKIIEAGEYL